MVVSSECNRESFLIAKQVCTAGKPAVPKCVLGWGSKLTNRLNKIAKFLPVIIIVMTIALGFSIYLLIGAAFDRAIERDAENKARGWAAYFAETLPALPQLIETGKATPEQFAIIRLSEKAGSVFHFNLFDPQGRLVLASDEAAKAPQNLSLREHNPEALAVLQSGKSDIEVKDGRNTPGRPDLYAEAYVPVTGADGKLHGIVEVYLDQTETQKLFRNSFFGIGLALAALMAVAFAIPAYAFYIRHRQALQAAEDVAHVRAANILTQEHAENLEQVNRQVSELNQQLAANMKRLQEAQEEIVRRGKMAQLGQLTATVAHEIRNPLGAVRTAAFLVERKTKGKGLGIEPMLQRIGNGVMRCDNIITQLLDFARSSTPQTQEKDFDDWLEKTVEEESHKLPARVTIECRLGLGGKIASFDPGRLQRAVINLVANASEAMVGKGDDPSKFACANPTIVVTTALTPRGLEVSITDNGPGIAPENIEKILEPLFTTKNFGTGLGLPAVQKILEQHGGGLEVKSKSGEGACFTAWMPLSQPQQQEAA